MLLCRLVGVFLLACGDSMSRGASIVVTAAWGSRRLTKTSGRPLRHIALVIRSEAAGVEDAADEVVDDEGGVGDDEDGVGVASSGLRPPWPPMASSS